jgi:hypothetical protein
MSLPLCPLRNWPKSRRLGGDDRFPGHVAHDLVRHQVTTVEVGLNRLAQGGPPRDVIAQVEPGGSAPAGAATSIMGGTPGALIA